MRYKSVLERLKFLPRKGADIIVRRAGRESRTNWWLIAAIALPVMIVIGVIMVNVIVGPAGKGITEGLERGREMVAEWTATPAATLAEFNKLLPGMNYRHVC